MGLLDQVLLGARGGVKIPISPSCLLVWIDETGEEQFSDPKYPIFGLGGCAVLAGDYGRCLASPWRDLKAKHFGGANVHLHATELQQPGNKQLDALGEFFRSGQFCRVATVLTALDRLIAASSDLLSQSTT